MLDKYFELYHRYNTRHVTPLVIEHYEHERLGRTPDEAYQMVANRLATDRDRIRCQAFAQPGGLEKRMEVYDGQM